MTTPHALTSQRRLVLNKVPEVTAYFWVIKVLCTTVGETAADFLNVNLGFGLTGTSVATGVLLAIVMVFQFRADRYVPGLYWSAAALVSVFGTLVTDNLTDNLGVPLQASTLVFSVILAGVFATWYRQEGTLSIHSIVTARRETFYWLAILFTFALGTATGDLMAEALSLGYVVTLLLVAGVVAVLAVAWRLGLHPVLAFWIIYILTRPLGASLGDLLSQPNEQGGLGLGPTVVSVVFLVAILGVVVYLAVSRADVLEADRAKEVAEGAHRAEAIKTSGWGGAVGSHHGVLQTVVVVAVLVVAAVIGYSTRVASLSSDSSSAAPAPTPLAGQPLAAAPAGTVTAPSAPAGPNARLGDLTTFRTITQDTLGLLNAGDQAGATSRVTDLEGSWDQAQGRLQARDKAAWTRLDTKIDAVLTNLRASSPDINAEREALNAVLAELG